MAPRDNFVELLRSADRRLAEVAPSPALEGRILARVRGEAPAEAPLARWLARARRPMLVLSVAMVLALVVVEGTDGEVMRANPVAASLPSSNRGELEAPPEIGPVDPEGPQECVDPESGRPCNAPAKSTPIERRVGPVTTARPPEAPSPILPPSLPNERVPAPSRREYGPEAPPPRSPPSSPMKPEGSSGAPPTTTPTAGYSYSPRLADEWAKGEPLAMRGTGPSASPGDASDPASPGVQTIPSKPEVEAPHEAEEEEPAANDPTETPSACVTSKLGDGATCFDYGDVKQQTYEICSAQKLVLVDLKIAGDCPDGSASLVEYTCCPIPEPSPSTMQCIGLALGDGSSCHSPEAWKQKAFDACAVEGLAPTNLGLAGDCPDGGSSYAKVECCGDVNDPGDPPPPPDACIYDALGDGTCQPDSAWKQQVSGYCAANGLSLGEIYYSMECPGGESGYVKFACCPQ